MGVVMAAQYLSLTQAAEILGIHPQTIRRAIARGDIPAFRVGFGRGRIRREDLEVILRPVSSRSEVAEALADLVEEAERGAE